MKAMIGSRENSTVADSMISRIHQGHVLGTAAFLTLPMAIFAPKGLAPLFAVAAVGAIAVAVTRDRKLPRLPRRLATLLGVFAALCGVSALWSVSPEDTLSTFPSVALTLLGGLVLVNTGSTMDLEERDWFEGAVVAGGCAGFGLLVIELLSGASMTVWLRDLVGKPSINAINPVLLLNSATTVAALYVWPCVWVAWYRRWWLAFAGLLAGALACAFLAQAGAPFAGLACGAVLFAAVVSGPRVVPAVFAAFLVAGVATAPLIPGWVHTAVGDVGEPGPMSYSGYHRLIIWEATANHIRNRPVLGHGFDTARALYDSSDRRMNYRFRADGTLWWKSHFEPIPLHPHNAILQIWLELGIVGASMMLGMLLVIVAAVAVAVRNRLDKAFGLGVLGSAVFISSVSFGIWQAWWMGALALLAAFCVGALPPSGGQRPD